RHVAVQGLRGSQAPQPLPLDRDDGLALPDSLELPPRRRLHEAVRPRPLPLRHRRQSQDDRGLPHLWLRAGHIPPAAEAGGSVPAAVRAQLQDLNSKIRGCPCSTRASTNLQKRLSLRLKNKNT